MAARMVFRFQNLVKVYDEILLQFSVTCALAPQELSRENLFFANVSWQPSSFAMDTLAKNEFSRESSCGASARVTEN